MNWNKFWEHEAHTPEVGEIAEHLNKAAKKSIDDIAAGQIKVVHNIGKLAHAFSHFVEPGNACDSQAYATCLTDNDSNPRRAFRFHGRCAKQTSCRHMDWHERKPYYHEGKHAARAAARGMEQIAHEVQQDMMTEMRSQEENAHHVL